MSILTVVPVLAERPAISGEARESTTARAEKSAVGNSAGAERNSGSRGGGQRVCGSVSRASAKPGKTVIPPFYAESPDRSGRAIHGIRSPLSCRIGADYTTRASYQAEYRKRNREAINARKRAWRKQNKLNATP